MWVRRTSAQPAGAPAKPAAAAQPAGGGGGGGKAQGRVYAVCGVQTTFGIRFLMLSTVYFALISMFGLLKLSTDFVVGTDVGITIFYFL